MEARNSVEERERERESCKTCTCVADRQRMNRKPHGGTFVVGPTVVSLTDLRCFFTGSIQAVQCSVLRKGNAFVM